MNTNKPSIDKKTKEHPHNVLITFWSFISDILNLKKGADIPGTIEGIKKDIDFKGPNVYILICSIIIASIGLNVNSSAAIIGAMLISPLMGPILGLGLSIGTYDWHTLKRSLKGLAIAVFVSLLTSFIYFKISPLQEIQQELLSRTRPTILDVFIALFGGLAGIVAGSRKEKSNVIPGVAIATALMPPLCTAGFGLATQNYTYFLGALYLFFINSVFICLATILIVRYMHFPLASWVDDRKKRRTRIQIAVFVFIVAIPSGFIFWDVIKESVFKNKAEKFITEQVKFEGAEIINKNTIYHRDSISTIEIFLIGEHVTPDAQNRVAALLPSFGLKKTNIQFYQNEGASKEIESMAGKLSQELRVGIIEDLYRKNEELLRNKDERIQFLEDKLFLIQKDSLPLHSIEKELKIQYEHLEKFAYAQSLEFSKDGKLDTIPTFLVHWNSYFLSKYRTTEKKNTEMKLEKWLEARLGLDTVRILHY
ncbi:MAG: DUF389 domain-containing protein [Cyclobacteriaceae bacterium]|nr:DUF389 domain-containing protein [Cyclobacteriaceae bacterium]